MKDASFFSCTNTDDGWQFEKRDTVAAECHFLFSQELSSHVSVHGRRAEKKSREQFTVHGLNAAEVRIAEL